jgi:hypothetical protein
VYQIVALLGAGPLARTRILGDARVSAALLAVGAG